MSKYCRRRGHGDPIVISPKFLPQGFRFLEPYEEIEEGDWYWSHTHKCYFPTPKKWWWCQARETIPFIRRK